MGIRRKIVTVVIFIVLGLNHSPGFATAADQRVEIGIAALKNGDYIGAQQWLESAENLYTTHPDFNNALALSHYYQQNYEQAKKYFIAARQTPRRHEAAYYLGDIYQQQGDLKTAAQWFGLAAEQYDDPEIQSAADQALLQLNLLSMQHTDYTDVADKKERFAFLALETGQVKGIVNPDETSASEDSDTSVALLAAGSMALTPSHSHVTLKIGGSTYAEKYTDFSSYDIESYNVFTSVGSKLGRHKLETKLSHAKFVLGGAPYLDQSGISIKDTIDMDGCCKFLLNARYTDVDNASEDYQHYAGTVAELGAQLRGGKQLKWRLGMTWRSEDRADLESAFVNDSGQGFIGYTSYSKDSVEAKGRLSWNWSKGWGQKMEIGLRSTEYKNADLYLQNSSDAELTELKRSSNRVQLKTELTRKITDTLDVSIGYEHLDENANNDAYDYTSQTVSAGIGYLF